MKYRNPFQRRWAWLALVATTVLAACANPVLRDAQQLEQSGQHEAALARLQQAADQSRGDTTVRNALIKQRDTTVAHLVYLAESARAAGRLDEVEAILRRLEVVAPGHPRAVWLRSEVDRLKRHQGLLAEARQSFDKQAYERAETALRTILAEDNSNNAARALLDRIDELREQQTRNNSTLKLATGKKPITLEFREASLRTVFEALSRAANVNFVFDKDVRAETKVSLFLRDTTVNEAMRVILSSQQLSFKLLNENTVMVFPNTQQKQRDLLDTVTRTFYLVNADPKQAQALVRTVAKTRDIFVDERLNLLVVRDTPEVVRLIERLIKSIDLPDPEVMLELEVMEVSSKRLDTIGVSWPTSAALGVTDATVSSLTSANGLRWSVANPLAIATLKGSLNNTNLLANPKIRARNREKAHVLLGEKLPVFTTTSSTQTSALTESVTYMDVGLKLDVEPQVQLDNDVTIKIALEVSSITGVVKGSQGSTAYQVGTRQATTSLRLKDGETQILAGLINDNESRNSAGIPGLHELPIAGRLFGTTSDSHDKTEIVLLITPRIVRNLNQPAASASPMPSGTEAQPGATPLLLPDGKAGVLPAGAGAASAGSPGRSRSSVSDPSAVALSGPEEVMPGSAFQVSVRNPGPAILRTSLSFDASLLEQAVAGAVAGSALVEVPARGTAAVTLRAKPNTTLADTDIVLDSGGEPLRLRIRSPSVAAPNEPGSAEPAREPPMEEPKPYEPLPNAPADPNDH
ncbi:MAG: secretin and TonB N-terminal domain-containing protein [Burkholderiales bacterium]|nr:secretin and TonB N-terminal domain-containing protein [Burkholderiales bacterium]